NFGRLRLSLVLLRLRLVGPPLRGRFHHPLRYQPSPLGTALGRSVPRGHRRRPRLRFGCPAALACGQSLTGCVGIRRHGNQLDGLTRIRCLSGHSFLAFFALESNLRSRSMAIAASATAPTAPPTPPTNLMRLVFFVLLRMLMRLADVVAFGGFAAFGLVLARLAILLGSVSLQLLCLKTGFGLFCAFLVFGKVVLVVSLAFTGFEGFDFRSGTVTRHGSQLLNSFA